jgi:hypothetical protein
MKKTTFNQLTLLLLVVLSIAFAFGCRKTRYTTRIEKAWKLESYIIGGVDSTSSFNTAFKNYVLEFYNNNGFNETYLDGGVTPVTKQGSWTLTDHSKTVELVDNGTTRSYDIVELKTSSLVLKKNGTEEELHLIPN